MTTIRINSMCLVLMMLLPFGCARNSAQLTKREQAMKESEGGVVRRIRFDDEAAEVSVKRGAGRLLFTVTIPFKIDGPFGGLRNREVQFTVRDHRNVVFDLNKELDPSKGSEFISLQPAVGGTYVFSGTVSEEAVEFPIVADILVRNHHATAEFTSLPATTGHNSVTNHAEQTQETNWRSADALHAGRRLAAAFHGPACLSSASRSVFCYTSRPWSH